MTGTKRNMIQPILCVALALGAIVPSAFAQLNSSTSGVALTATLPESIGITAPSTATWTTLTPGTTTSANSTLAIVTTWVLASSRSNVELDAYFASAAHALTDGSAHYIPSSAVFGAVSGADTVSSTAFTASTTLGAAGAGLTLFSHALTTDFNATRSDTLTLVIDLTGVTIPAAVYTGTITLEAQAL